MDKALFQEMPERQRAQMVADNCDDVEQIGYMKQFSPEQVSGMKDDLAETSIRIAEIEDEKKAVTDEFKERLKPLVEQKKKLLDNIKNKAEFVREDCYKFIDHEEGMVGFYNAEGLLIESRPIRPEERQARMFPRTGTNN